MERRSLLKWLIGGISAAFSFVIGLPSLLYVLDPRNRPTPTSAFRTVAKLDELEKDKPRAVAIRAARRDAWNVNYDDIIGRVWLIRRDEAKVDAYTSVCPHLGCQINFEAAATRFVCPCHGGTFDLQCQRMELEGGTANPAPRGMDQLEAVIEKDPAGTSVVKVKYQSFVQGHHDKQPKT